MQKFQRRLFYAPVSSDDNALIENSKDSGTNNDSNTNIKIANLTLGYSLLAASQRSHNYHLRIIQHTKPHASCCISSSRLAQRRAGIGNQDKRSGGQCK
jgi:hypothetical protein